MKKGILVLSLIVSLIGVLVGCSSQSSGKDVAKPDKITLDYAFYSPTSLVIKEFGWAEEEFKEDGIGVEYVLSQGSNKALEFLNSGSVDFGSTAGAAALMAKANNSPVETVYIYSKPEWTALVMNGKSSIKTVEDLKGKKVAATIGTDPYIFLLRALNEVGLDSSDIEIVNLQHSDGASSLVTEQVDAWAGLDPHMAKLELTENAKLFYRNPDFNTYGTLNVTKEFANKYPDLVERTIKVYERARKWVIDNPEAAAEILAKAAEIDIEVAKKQLERTDLSQPIPGEEHIRGITEAGEVLKKGNIIDRGSDIDQLVNELINSDFSQSIK